MNAPAVVMALFNGAWQGAVLCAAAYALLRGFRGLNAATRYAIWSTLLLIALALPAANFAFSARPITQVQRVTEVAGPRLAPRHGAGENAAALKAPAAALYSIAPRLTAYQSAIHQAARLSSFSIYALYALLALVLLRLVLLGRDVVRMIAARAAVRAIPAPFALRDPVQRPYAFASSPGFSVPCVLGFKPALIVIPESLLESADERALLSVVLHEHEHVMRFDDVQNVLHRLAGAVGFVMPGVHLALRELALCREQICDDAAIAGAGGDRHAYARTLSAMAGWAGKSAVPVPCFIFKRKQLLRRIEVLVDAAVSHSLRPNLRFAAIAGGALVLFAAVALRFQVPVFAEHISFVAPKAPNPAPALRVTRAVPAAPPVRHVKKLPPAAAPKAAKVVKSVPAAPVVKEGKNAPQARVVIMRTRGAAPQVFTSYSSSGTGADTSTSTSTSANTSADTSVTTAVWTSNAPVAQRAGTRDRPADLLDALSRAGYDNLSVDDLINLRNHGVTGMLVANAAAFFGHVPVADLIQLADQGITGIYLTDLRNDGVSGLTPAAVVDLRNHGVMATFIGGLRQRGYFLSTTDLIRLADHGVSLHYVDAVQRIRSRGRLSVDEIIRLRDAGFFP